MESLFDDPEAANDTETPVQRTSRASARQPRGTVGPGHAAYLSGQASLAQPVRDLPADATQEERDAHQRNVWRAGLAAELRAKGSRFLSADFFEERWRQFDEQRAADLAAHEQEMADLALQAAQPVPEDLPLDPASYPATDPRLEYDAEAREAYRELKAWAAEHQWTAAQFTTGIEDLLRDLTTVTPADLEDERQADELERDLSRWREEDAAWRAETAAHHAEMTRLQTLEAERVSAQRLADRQAEPERRRIRDARWEAEEAAAAAHREQEARWQAEVDAEEAQRLEADRLAEGANLAT